MVDFPAITGPGATSQNVGGGTKRIRIAAKSWFATIATKIEISDPALAAASDLIEITDDHTFNTGKGWIEFYATRDSVEGKYTMNQERDTTGSLAEFFSQIPGGNTSDLGSQVMVCNDQTIICVEQANGEGWIQVGSERFPAECKFEWDLGKNTGKYRGSKFSFTGFETTPQFYLGAFTMHP